MSIQLKIRVTKDILYKTRYCGLPFAPTNCAIAVAVRDIFPNAYVTDIAIHLDTKYLSSIYLPDEAQDFISRFDTSAAEQRVKMPELEFEVSLDDEIIEQLVNIDDIKQLLKDHPTLSIIET